MITIKIDRDPLTGERVDVETIKLNASRSLNGDIMIFDHEDVDIVVVPSKRKCVVFPKDEIDDKAYGAQDRLFNVMTSRGVVDPASVRGGSFYGAMEATIFESAFEGIDEVQAALYVIHRFIEEERPYFEATSRISHKSKDHILHPDDEHSTELGDVPHDPRKGSMVPTVRPYGYMYNYSLIREDSEES
jgi:hypothetical protein